jgi:acyl-coenzyme A thioesterase PaaI-like protein
MSESWQSKLLRWRLNLFRPYRNSGARVTFIDRSFQIVRIRLPLSGATRNLYHSIFGGSMYSAVDPVHATMLMFHCGQEFAAWTKEARIQFRRPARSELTGEFILEDSIVAEVRGAIARDGKAEQSFHIDLVDCQGEICFSCDLLVHIRKRQGKVKRVGSWLKGTSGSELGV